MSNIIRNETDSDYSDIDSKPISQRRPTPMLSQVQINEFNLKDEEDKHSNKSDDDNSLSSYVQNEDDGHNQEIVNSDGTNNFHD